MHTGIHFHVIYCTAAGRATYVLRAQVGDEQRHEGCQHVHRELIPEGIDELDAVRPHDGSSVYIQILGRGGRHQDNEL